MHFLACVVLMRVWLQTEEETVVHVEVGGILQEDLRLASATHFNFIDIGTFHSDFTLALNLQLE